MTGANAVASTSEMVLAASYSHLKRLKVKDLNMELCVGLWQTSLSPFNKSVTVYDPFLTSAWLSNTYTQHAHSQDSVPDEKDQPRTSRGVHEAAEELSQERC
ncbi:hypothetical protein CAPTEDRAFT_215940 [Capitella teleta]|uniref:Uncharacterized protein n=1 Tax=Capitella teleta TaxID=283909 RepID=R7VCF0_CAPTE|nr:hypothetical protein CAPTEDRAFT_215940 [Capitella teleta]|eukprot:ELU16212.1 hypothetical protein CAPTEDRAFT_215940 [Capitella teleta]